MLAEVEELFLINGNCNAIIFDTWHTISCLEDEKPRGGSERNRRVEVCVGSLKVMPE
jgi:hypothetical protein